MDPVLKEIVEVIQQRRDVKTCYEVKGGILLYKNRLVLQAKSSIIPMLLKDFHSSPTGGHPGFLRTYRSLSGTLFCHGI